MRKDHDKRTLTFYPLREVGVTRFNPTVKTPVIMDQSSTDADRKLGTSGKALKLRKTTVFNNYAMSGPCVLGYLETLL